MYYVNHVLFVILRTDETSKNVFGVLILQVPFGGRTLDLTNYMNDQIEK